MVLFFTASVLACCGADFDFKGFDGTKREDRIRLK